MTRHIVEKAHKQNKIDPVSKIIYLKKNPKRLSSVSQSKN